MKNISRLISIFSLGKLSQPHYNEEGFKLAAKLIYKKLMN